MNANSESERAVASVLVIAADPNIEVLVSELVAFAGHRPLHDPTSGAAGESLRRERPEVAILDTALPSAVVTACLLAADEVGCCPILTSSTASTLELATQAEARGLLHFPIPGGPAPLGRLIAKALNGRRRTRAITLKLRAATEDARALRPAFCAALSAVARARAFGLHHHGAAHSTNGSERAQRALVLARRSRAALRAAVTDFARLLQQSGASLDEGQRQIRDAIDECAVAVGAEPVLVALRGDLESWTRDAYAGASMRSVGELPQRGDAPDRLT